MVYGYVRGLFRGVRTWGVGYVGMVVLLGLGIVDRGGGLLQAGAETYLAAHALPFAGPTIDPLYLVVVPVAAIGVAGYRVGQSVRAGVTGRLRSAVESLTGSTRDRHPSALSAAVELTGGYTVVAVIVAVVVGSSIVYALLGALVYGLVVGGVTAILGSQP